MFRRQAANRKRQETTVNVSIAEELISLLSGRASARQALWTVFCKVSAAIVMLIASGILLPEYRWVASSVAAAGFLPFAYGNYRALDELRTQRNAVVEYVRESAEDSPHILAVAETAAPPTLHDMLAHPRGLCASVAVLLFAIPAFQ